MSYLFLIMWILLPACTGAAGYFWSRAQAKDRFEHEDLVTAGVTTACAYVLLGVFGRTAVWMIPLLAAVLIVPPVITGSHWFRSNYGYGVGPDGDRGHPSAVLQFWWFILRSIKTIWYRLWHRRADAAAAAPEDDEADYETPPRPSGGDGAASDGDSGGGGNGHTPLPTMDDVSPDMTPADHRAVATRIAGFEPENDAELAMFLKGEAAGAMAVASAWRHLAGTCASDVGLDPTVTQAMIELSDMRVETAHDAVMVLRQFFGVYADILEAVARGVKLPYKARQWLTAEGL
jgi:hypothetical protein